MAAIDWDAVVLGPCMDTFALTDASVDPTTTGQVQFNPINSQPGQPAYAGRCVWEVVQYFLTEENNAPLATSIIKIGLRLKDFTVPPAQGDQVTINGETYTLDRYEYDGQGGVRWEVKSSAPGQQTQYANQS